MKTIPKPGIVACCVAVLSTALLYAQLQPPAAKSNSECMALIENCLRDFETIKAGMTRSEIEDKFPMDGGIQGVSPVRFTHPACPCFKIDVEFDFKRDGADQNRAIWGKEDKATKASKPYLERPFVD